MSNRGDYSRSTTGPLRKYAEPVLHVLFAGLAIGFFLVGKGSSWEGIPTPVTWFVIVVPALVFYGNVFGLLPRVLDGRNVWVYLVSLGTSLAVVCLMYLAVARMYLTGVDDLIAFVGSGHPANVIFFNFMGLSLVASFMYWFARQRLLKVRAIEKLERSHIEMELDLLKSQIDPHFIFNTLNTIYAVALEEEAVDTAESITRLSSLMRYSLTDAAHDRIPLDRELEYVQRYVELQKMRLANRNRIAVDLVAAADSDLQIAPMLLLPFIENVFKHGVSTTVQTNATIEIGLEGSRLGMKIENDIPGGILDEVGGLGIANTRRRLEMLYPDRHNLEHGARDERYFVSLQMELDP